MAKQAKQNRAKQEQARLQAAFGLAPEGHQVHLLSPEGVPILTNRVPPFTRLGALSLDVGIQIGIIFLMQWFLIAWFGFFVGPLIEILWTLFFALMRMPYFILMEYYFRGQTIGKKVVGIRVVDEAGGRLRVSSLIVRNITREIEVTLPLAFMLGTLFDPLGSGGWTSILLLLWVLFVFIFPFTNKDRKRLGDMLAGTVVVSVEKPKLLKDMAAQKVARDFTFTTAQLAAYGEFEVQVLQRILAQDQSLAQLKPIALAIIKKIGYRGRLRESEVRDFLTAFYQAQRKYLEERLLVGKRRGSKLDTETEV